MRHILDLRPVSGGAKPGQSSDGCQPATGPDHDNAHAGRECTRCGRPARTVKGQREQDACEQPNPSQQLSPRARRTVPGQAAPRCRHAKQRQRQPWVRRGRLPPTPPRQANHEQKYQADNGRQRSNSQCVKRRIHCGPRHTAINAQQEQPIGQDAAYGRHHALAPSQADNHTQDNEQQACCAWQPPDFHHAELKITWPVGCQSLCTCPHR